MTPTIPCSFVKHYAQGSVALDVMLNTLPRVGEVVTLYTLRGCIDGRVSSITHEITDFGQDGKHRVLLQVENA